MQQRNSALKICLPWNNSIRTLMRQLQKGESANLLTLRDVALCKKTNATTAPDSRRNLAREQRQRDLKNVVSKFISMDIKLLMASVVDFYNDIA